MRVADFFCGAGGFSEGFRQAGFDIVFAIDKWLPAFNTYKANKPNTQVFLDDVIRVSKLPEDEFEKIVPDTEIIIGSPPCVAFSSSNRSGNGDKALGLQLLKAYLRIVARKKYKKGSLLRYWVLENVPNIEKYIEAEYTAKDLEIEGNFRLRALGETSRVYNAKYFGVPSSRKRFLCGEFPEPHVTNDDATVIPMRHVFDSLGEPTAGDRTIITDCNYHSLSLNIGEVTDHQYKYMVSDFEWQKAKRLKQDKGYMGKMSFPENIDKPSRTVMATMSASSRESMILGCGDGTYRLPTVREIASMMSFPIDYRFYGISKGIKYSLVGNAVPPKLSYAIAKAISEQERHELPGRYIPIQHNESIHFYNLNNIEIQAKIEKQKRKDAKFKYHIPYLIYNAYRVELTNYNSDFKNNKFLWTAEIHFSQGKKKACVHTPTVKIIDIHNQFRDEITTFIKGISGKLCNEYIFQMRYCATDAQRTNLIGPYELLERIRQFLDEILTSEQQKEMRELKENPYKVPCAIQIGYYILNECTKIIRGYN